MSHKPTITRKNAIFCQKVIFALIFECYVTSFFYENLILIGILYAKILDAFIIRVNFRSL